jgi:uncharacterized protein YijF (DUF1287 family)
LEVESVDGVWPQRRCVALLAAVALSLAGAALEAKPLEREPPRTAATNAPLADAYGVRLARVARWQSFIPALYNPSYRQIPYPGGDVPWYLGVCTDVIVRAYRRLGVDLQVKVHQAGVGSGDTSIDHRRVEVLRRFFAQAGQSLPVTDRPADYRPGDVVSYYVPDGWFSKTHIAIVSDRKVYGGVPLIIHNRGFGVVEENRLFAEKITGHYRYQPGRDPS